MPGSLFVWTETDPPGRSGLPDWSVASGQFGPWHAFVWEGVKGMSSLVVFLLFSPQKQKNNNRGKRRLSKGKMGSRVRGTSSTLVVVVMYSYIVIQGRNPLRPNGLQPIFLLKNTVKLT